MANPKQVLIQSIQEDTADTVDQINAVSNATLDALYTECRNFFEDDLAFAKWLVSPFTPIGGQSPLNFAKNPGTIIQLADALDGIHYGVCS